MKRFRFRSVVALANTKMSVKSAAIILAISTIISALLGFWRDYLLNSYYLKTYPTGLDAYTAAFTVPDFMFFVLTSGALSVSFIPIFNQRLASGNKKSAWEISSSFLNLLSIATLIASILIMIFADPLIRYVVACDLDEAGMALAINMTRVLAINPLLFSITTVLTSVQQAVGRFIFYSFAPAIYNIGIIIGTTVFTNGINIFGIQIFDGGIMGVAIGVILGAILQLGVSFIGLIGLDMDYDFKIYWKNQGFRSILKLLPARSLDQGIDYANSIASTNLASGMGAGAIRSFNQATTLHQMPVNLIGVAISTAFFPKMTEELNDNNEKEYNDTLRSALRTIIWITLPVCAVTFFGRGYVVSLISNQNFSSGNTTIASALGALVPAIFSRSIFHILSRAFYARKDTKTPFLVSVVSIGLTIVLSFVFANSGFGVDGLAYAQSIGAILEAIILLAILQHRSKQKLINKSFWNAFARMCIATIITSCVTYSMVKFIPLMASDATILSIIPKFALIAIVSLISYGIASYFFNLDEIKPIMAYLKKTLFKSLK